MRELVVASLIGLVFSFATPICFAQTRQAEREAQVAPGIPHPGWLGFVFSYHEASAAGSPVRLGQLYVHRVIAGGPAANAGLEEGDIILSIDHEPVKLPDRRAVVDFFAKIRPGAKVELQVMRNGRAKPQALTLVPIEMPPEHLKQREQLWRSVYVPKVRTGGS